MKRTILLTLLITICTSVFAQIKDLNKENIEYSFYMNNGRVIRGKLIDFKAKEYAKVETDDHKIVEVKLAEVSKVTKQDFTKDIHKIGSNYVGYFDVGAGLATDKILGRSFRMNFINAVTMGKRSSLGLGVGYRHYLTIKKFDIPFYLNFKTNLGRGNDRELYLDASIGTALGKQLSSIGFYISPCIGINLKPINGIALKLFCGYEMQRIQKVNFNKALRIGVGTSF